MLKKTLKNSKVTVNGTEQTNQHSEEILKNTLKNSKVTVNELNRLIKTVKRCLRRL